MLQIPHRNLHCKQPVKTAEKINLLCDFSNPSVAMWNTIMYLFACLRFLVFRSAVVCHVKHILVFVEFGIIQKMVEFQFSRLYLHYNFSRQFSTRTCRKSILANSNMPLLTRRFQKHSLWWLSTQPFMNSINSNLFHHDLKTSDCQECNC